jgi:hypothetical protein
VDLCCGDPGLRNVCFPASTSGGRAHNPSARVPAIFHPFMIGLLLILCGSRTVNWLRSSRSYVSFCTTCDRRLARGFHTLRDAASKHPRVLRCPALRSGPASPLQTWTDQCKRTAMSRYIRSRLQLPCNNLALLDHLTLRAFWCDAPLPDVSRRAASSSTFGCGFTS